MPIRPSVPLMLRYLGSVVILLAVTAPSLAAKTEPKRPNQETFLKRAVFTDGRLWLLSDAGDLSTIKPDADVRTPESLPEPVIDLCVRNRVPTVATCPRKECGDWTVRHRVAEKWVIDAVVPAEADDLWNLNCTAETITLLTSRRLVEVTGDKQTAVTLSEELGPGLVASAYVSAEQVYVGMNAGEWGGGLRRIDRRTGKVTVVERNATGGLCEGPLNTACDPVNGIAPEPWRPDCQAAAIGLVHFSPHGRIVEICGDKVKRIYFKAFGKTPQPRRGGKSDEPFETVAFFGLMTSGDALWATGIDGLYRVSRDGKTTVTPLPKFSAVGGISVSFDLPQFVLVVTRINQRLSISGAVPMLVPR